MSNYSVFACIHNNGTRRFPIWNKSLVLLRKTDSCKRKHFKQTTNSVIYSNYFKNVDFDD